MGFSSAGLLAPTDNGRTMVEINSCLANNYRDGPARAQSAGPNQPAKAAFDRASRQLGERGRGVAGDRVAAHRRRRSADRGPAEHRPGARPHADQHRTGARDAHWPRRCTRGDCLHPGFGLGRDRHLRPRSGERAAGNRPQPVRLGDVYCRRANERPFVCEAGQVRSRAAANAA